MLRGAIERCPDSMWADDSYRNPFWRIAYHALYYAHLYAQPDAESFVPWERHQTGLHDMDDVPAPPEIQELTEHPHRPPRTGKPLSQQEILRYWEVCDGLVDETIDGLDLGAEASGFSWYPIPKIEHLMVSIRHIQHHAAQLAERLRTACDVGVDWVGARRPR
jgi:hypothetical protein